MSGHSKWATIHRQKEVKDAARGQLFSKVARAIAVAARSGGPDLDTNIKLREALDKARQANVPKENIERAIKKATGEGEAMYEEVTYEGYGPKGIAVIVEAATDNKNRTGQEIKNLFERAGGRLAGPGAVSYIFEQKGSILVDKGDSSQDTMLSLIDLGVEDLEETDDGIEAYTPADRIYQTRKLLEEKGFRVLSSDLVLAPRQFIQVKEVSQAKKILQFLNALELNEDVQKVWANVDITEND